VQKKKSKLLIILLFLISANMCRLLICSTFFVGVADSPPPPTTTSHNTTVIGTVRQQPERESKALQKAKVVTRCDADSLALQLGDFCSNEVITSSCCKAVMSTVNRYNSAESPCLCQVTDTWDFLSTGLGIDNIIDLYDKCMGRQGVHRLFHDVCGWWYVYFISYFS
jgi:hypothetical protein